jgi:serine/threonine-protein kinase RsbT
MRRRTPLARRHARISPVPGSNSEARLPADAKEIRVRIDSDRAIVEARQLGRELANHAGFGPTDQAIISTAISELARNTLRYAQVGDITVALIDQTRGRGIVITATDEGPGIRNIPQAMVDGFSTSGSLGLGLPGVKRLMDEFEIVSEAGHGTTVVAKKWTR